jgi:hypothetical protein
MTFPKLLMMLGCAALLTACATDGTTPSATAARPTLERVLADASAANVAGQPDQAFVLLKGGAAAYPADKGPWLQMAQMRFDRGNYGDAISNALEALQRDPDDKLANSIIAVSGLRLSTRAIGELTRKNNVSGSLRSEARDLAKLLRTSLGEEVLVPAAGVAGKARAGAKPVREAANSKAKAAPPAASGQDPFGGLK